MNNDKELQEYRDLLKAPDHFEEGFDWKTIVGAVFIGFLMMPGSMYLQLVIGQGIGPRRQMGNNYSFRRNSQTLIHRTQAAGNFSALLYGWCGIGLTFLWIAMATVPCAIRCGSNVGTDRIYPYLGCSAARF